MSATVSNTQSLPIDDVITKLHVKNYKIQMTRFLLTTRFNNSTFQENVNFRAKNANVGCIYCSPDMISQSIPLDSILFILEMNNETNKITGIGMVRNRPIINKYYVYQNGNYNRYVYLGKYRIDRDEMTEQEEKIMQIFDILCFKGNRHMKRGQGIKSFPVDILYRFLKTIDLVNFISEMYKRKMIQMKLLP